LHLINGPTCSFTVSGRCERLFGPWAINWPRNPPRPIWAAQQEVSFARTFVFLARHNNHGTPPLALLDRKSAGLELGSSSTLESPGAGGSCRQEVGRPPHLALWVGPPMAGWVQCYGYSRTESCVQHVYLRLATISHASSNTQYLMYCLHHKLHTLAAGSF
jgi:hypothetical protein